MIHYANLKTSRRLQNLDSYMSDRKWHKTLEVQRDTGIVAVSTAMSELRHNLEKQGKCTISPARYIEMTRNGSKVFAYRMVDV